MFREISLPAGESTEIFRPYLLAIVDPGHGSTWRFDSGPELPIVGLQRIRFTDESRPERIILHAGTRLVVQVVDSPDVDVGIMALPNAACLFTARDELWSRTSDPIDVGWCRELLLTATVSLKGGLSPKLRASILLVDDVGGELIELGWRHDFSLDGEKRRSGFVSVSAASPIRVFPTGSVYGLSFGSLVSIRISVQGASKTCAGVVSLWGKP